MICKLLVQSCQKFQSVTLYTLLKKFSTICSVLVVFKILMVCYFATREAKWNYGNEYIYANILINLIILEIPKMNSFLKSLQTTWIINYAQC